MILIITDLSAEIRKRVATMLSTTESEEVLLNFSCHLNPSPSPLPPLAPPPPLQDYLLVIVRKWATVYILNTSNDISNSTAVDASLIYAYKVLIVPPPPPGALITLMYSKPKNLQFK
jgi:hypothetical protein